MAGLKTGHLLGQGLRAIEKHMINESYGALAEGYGFKSPPALAPFVRR